MLERTHIQSSGFDNLGPSDARNGFRVRVRQPNYRGMRVSLLEGIDVIVDRERFPAEGNRILINGREYSHAELDDQIVLRWAVGMTVDVLVDKPGGLEPGVHLVETSIRLRHPYFPPLFRPVSMNDSRHVTIIVR
ncbi:DUF6379 domain-containing protein [Sphingorhabdus sp.]|uniref:C-glycoside deglycosidase beta subunit domain-containing protein n=1 Tax=Sphingorhabdus sp. TaxID=1902408 RepID=UPI00391BEBA6